MPATNPVIPTWQKKGRVSVAQTKGRALSPTSEAYGALQFAYDYKNKRLFGDRLPPVLFTLTRNPRSLGYFAPERFRNTEGSAAHEISLNPQYLEDQGDYGALDTLVHEMCHVAHWEFSPRTRNGRARCTGYHDRWWADEMLRVGLVPSDTGQPGGKQTGPRMSDYPEPDGPFDLAARELLISGFTIDWRDSVVKAASGDAGASGGGRRPNAPRRPRGHGPTRAKFTCPMCRLNAWAKPSAVFACVPCRAVMVAA